jgi:hypothetical protein
VNRYGLARQLEWGGLEYSFCSNFCEFFRRRTRCTDDALSEAASSSVHEVEKPLLSARQSASKLGVSAVFSGRRNTRDHKHRQDQ